MNYRSLRFRLIGYFAALLIATTLAFGAFTYTGLKRFLESTLEGALAHRAGQVAAMAGNIPREGEQAVAEEIEARYAPARNDRFVRVTRPDGPAIYLSNAPNDRSFDPAKIPPYRTPAAEGTRREALSDGSDILIVSRNSNGFRVEVGASLLPGERVLHRLLIALAAGLPVLAALAIGGGIVLVKRALQPVAEITRTAQDITLRHLDRRLPVLASGDEIANLSSALNGMIARLDDSFQHVARFTADASHELRTPLTIIRGELETLVFHGALPEDLRVALSSLLEEIEHLSRIVERLFALSRLDTGEAQSERVRVDLANLAETTAEQMCLLAEEKHIELICANEGQVEIEGDRARLKQIVVNLLDNAIKYTPEHGRVEMTVKTRDQSALLEVSDTGLGIPETALPHIFERFFRADDTHSRSTEGAGLGLSIVQSICHAHGGSISAANRSPAGCLLTVELPLARKA